jgi:dTDP-4-dehydrorhamnose reductase
MMTVYNMIVEVARHLQLDEMLITPVTENDLAQPARRPPKTGFNISKARNDLNFHPTVFRQGLFKTFKP